MNRPIRIDSLFKLRINIHEERIQKWHELRHQNTSDAAGGIEPEMSIEQSGPET